MTGVQTCALPIYALSFDESEVIDKGGVKGGFVNPIRTRQGEGKKLPSPTLTLTLITERMMNRGMQGKCEGVRVNHV